MITRVKNASVAAKSLQPTANFDVTAHVGQYIEPALSGNTRHAYRLVRQERNETANRLHLRMGRGLAHGGCDFDRILRRKAANGGP